MKYRIETITTSSSWSRSSFQRQVVALRDIPMHGVKAGDRGGYVSGPHNLSQDGECWIGGRATVSGNAAVTGDALVTDSAVISDNAVITDNAKAYGYARIFGNARIEKNAEVFGFARVYQNAVVTNSAKVSDVRVYGLKTRVTKDRDRTKPATPKKKKVSTTVHKDILGKSLAINDFVVFVHGNTLYAGKVIDQTPKMVRVAQLKYLNSAGYLVYGSACKKIPEKEVTFFLLSQPVA